MLYLRLLITFHNKPYLVNFVFSSIDGTLGFLEGLSYLFNYYYPGFTSMQQYRLYVTLRYTFSHFKCYIIYLFIIFTLFFEKLIWLSCVIRVFVSSLHPICYTVACWSVMLDSPVVSAVCSSIWGRFHRACLRRRSGR